MDCIDLTNSDNSQPKPKKAKFGSNFFISSPSDQNPKINQNQNVLDLNSDMTDSELDDPEPANVQTKYSDTLVTPQDQSNQLFTTQQKKNMEKVFASHRNLSRNYGNSDSNSNSDANSTKSSQSIESNEIQNAKY